MPGENFKEVTMGTGILKVNDVDVGLLHGDVTYKYNYDVAEFKNGVPKMLKGSTCKEIIAEITAPMAQISADNIAIVLGGLTPATTAASEVDKTATFEEHTFAACSWSPGMENIKLGVTDNYPLWVAISTGGDAPVIKDSTEVTTYTENTDYVVDYDSGIIYRNPGGSISSSETVKVKYKYTPPASKQINLGATFSIATVSLEFTHTNPNTGLDSTVYMWKANASGNAEFTFAEENWMVMNPTFKAVYDSTHPTNPLGYINIEEE